MMFTLRKHNRWLTTATATALVKKNMILMIVGFGEKTIEMLKNAATSASFFFSLFMNSWISAISVHLANIHIYIYLLFPCSSDFDCNSRFYENAPGEVECLDLIHQTHQMVALTKTLNQTQD